jgi:putative two-component system response regulator
MFQEILKHSCKVYAAPSGERAMTFLGNHTPDLILIDAEMLEMSEYDLIKRIKEEPRLSSIPLLFLTAQKRHEKEERVFQRGATDYILKPISKNTVLARVNLNVELENYRRRLDTLISEETGRLSRTQDSMLDMLANTSSRRSGGTAGRPDRTAAYTRVILEGLANRDNRAYSIPPVHREYMIRASKLRDIGKMHVADGILLKPGKLTGEEFAEIKKHAALGATMIDGAAKSLGDDPSFLPAAREIAMTHHEWWNGSGYPGGLAGDAIPISGRVTALSDMYESLTSNRPYRDAMTHGEAVSVIYGETGTHFDPKMMELLDYIFPKFAEISGAP